MHQHNHSHIKDDSDNRIAMAFFLNVGFTIIEFIGGWLTNSTAIMADAVHDLGDSLSIGSAWLLNRLGRKSANRQFTYGYRRLSLFGALINGLVLIAGSVWVLTEAIPRLANPVMPVTEGMLALAVLGVAVNGFAAYRLSKGNTLNEKVLNWHLLEDFLGWVAVLVVAIVLQFVDWPILDPLLSIGFTLFILVNVLRNLSTTARLFLQAAPDSKLQNEIQDTLLKIDELDSIHHLHLWSLDGEHHVLTAHVVTNASKAFTANHYADIKLRIANALEQFDLAHTTIELELTQEHCRLLFALLVAEKRSFSLGAVTCCNQSGIICLVVNASPNGCWTCLRGLWRSIRNNSNSLVVGSRWHSTTPLGSGWRGANARRHGSDHVCAEINNLF